MTDDQIIQVHWNYQLNALPVLVDQNEKPISGLTVLAETLIKGYQGWHEAEQFGKDNKAYAVLTELVKSYPEPGILAPSCAFPQEENPPINYLQDKRVVAFKLEK